MNEIRQNKIIILGGYGGNNVGDDAQLEGSLNDLKTAFPSATLIVLTPDLDQTARRHSLSAVGYASRVAFFDFDDNWRRYSHYDKKHNTKWLIDRVGHILTETKNYFNGDVHKLTKKQLALINEIKTARLVYFSGGGYMTGPTASRLWDAMAVVEVASIFRTPVCMSGQNIGIWACDYDKSCASKGFPKVTLIGTRDKTFSAKALKEVGVSEVRILATHDDALFIDQSNNLVIDYIFRKVGLSSSKNIISLSLHFLEGSLEIIHAIRDVSDMPIVLIPTCPPDQKVQKTIFESTNNAGLKDIYIIRKLHSFNEIKGLIGKSYICISSRHHPLIFAMGNSVPCVSINVSPYFDAKNYGALDLLDSSDFSIDFQKDDLEIDPILLMKRKIAFAIKNRDYLSKKITRALIAVQKNKKLFINLVKDIYNSD